MFWSKKAKRKKAGDWIHELCAGLANAVSERTGTILGRSHISPEVLRHTASDESVAFLYQLIYSLAVFEGAYSTENAKEQSELDLFAWTLVTRIFFENISGLPSVPTPSRIPEIIQKAQAEFSQRLETPLTRALWAGNGCAAQIKIDRRLTLMVVASWVSGVMRLQTDEYDSRVAMDATDLAIRERLAQ